MDEIEVVRSAAEVAALPPETKAVKGDGLGDEDVAAFARLPALEVAYLDGCRELGDAAFEVLGSLPVLRELYITAHRATEEGLRHLAGSERLEELGLDLLGTGEGFAHLEGHPALRELHLPGWPNLDPENLRHLAALPRLEKVCFYNVAALTPEVGVRLAEALPGVDIQVR